MTGTRGAVQRILVLAAWLAATPAVATAREIVVDPAGPIPSLTAALRLANPGDRIVVHAGTYREPTIVVDRRVEIVGEGSPLFDGGGDHQVFTVTADSVTIRGLVIANVGGSAVEDRAAIKFVEVHGCVVEHNELRDVFFGIYLARSSGCRIAGNRIRGSGVTDALSGNAIHLWNCSGITVEHNEITGHRDGIYLEFTTDSKVLANRSTHNLRYGLHFMFSHGCEYFDNTFAENGAGVAVMYSHDVTMKRNRFELNRGSAAFGLLLKDITDSRVEANRFAGNSTALYAEGANRVTVAGNEFLDNGWAFRIMADAQDNTVRGNRFEGNSFDVATNGTSNSSLFTENYWDRYAGYDLDRDGYGDAPFAPVRLFSFLVQRDEPVLILLRSFFVDLLDVAERVFPVLTPETLVDRRPLMHWPVR